MQSRATLRTFKKLEPSYRAEPTYQAMKVVTDVYLAERGFIYSLDRKAVYEAYLDAQRVEVIKVCFPFCSVKVQLNFRALSRKPHNLYAIVKCMKHENSAKILIK